MVDWASHFYEQQDRWSEVYCGPVGPAQREKMAVIARLAGPGPRRILELGAGGGQNAAAMVELGHEVWAIELVPRLARRARALAAELPAGRLRVLAGDFTTIDLDERFDLVVYWDGFGLDDDAGQSRLLRRIAGWMEADGGALLDVYTPWYWARVADQEMTVGRAHRRYGFDARECRMLDTWWTPDDPAGAVTQSLRCYSPADLRLLLPAVGLALAAVESGGAVDYAAGRYRPRVPLEEAMAYTAYLVRT